MYKSVCESIASTRLVCTLLQFCASPASSGVTFAMDFTLVNSEPSVQGFIVNVMSAIQMTLQNFASFHTKVSAERVKNLLGVSYSKVIVFLLSLLMEAVIVCFLLFTMQLLPFQLENIVLVIFSVVCIYGATASLRNGIFNKELISKRPSLLKKLKPEEKVEVSDSCRCPDSRRTSSLKTIAALLDEGGVCGVPTDTVYALAASCKHPEAIQKIYTIKDRPLEKPICICISHLGQLRDVNAPFSKLLWDFMESVYPGGISCIVPKGEWLKKLGVGPAYDIVGTKDSIMIRVPDHTICAHLTDMTGPLAITSANPSGESDSTHHDMVISRLSHKLEGVLCDGHSNEMVGSTVVNCLRIDEGILGIVREGCVPTANVMQTFERVKSAQV